MNIGYVAALFKGVFGFVSAQFNSSLGGSSLANGTYSLAVMNSTVAYPLTSDGLDDAIARIASTNKPGTVYLANADYVISRDHSLVSNVSIVGFIPKLVMTGDVPDAGFSCSGGSRFICAAGVKALKWNNIAKEVEETNIAENALTGVTLYGITFVGGARAVDTGAYLAMGAAWCVFDQLYSFDQTEDFAFNWINFQHCTFGKVYQSSGDITVGGGVRFGSSLSATLLPGNSTINDEIYTYCKNRKNRSIVIEAYGPAGCVLNELKVSGRLQANRYGAATPDAITATTTSGVANILVSDITKFAVGMPCVFHATAPTSFSVDIVFFVMAVDIPNSTITLSELEPTVVTPGSSGTYTLSVAGYPGIEIKASTGDIIANSDFGLLDVEAYGNVCGLYIKNTTNCFARVGDMMVSLTDTNLATRNAGFCLEYANSSAIKQDRSGSHGLFCARNAAGGPIVYSGGSFSLNSSHSNQKMRYSGTTDITITIPANLPKGFEFSITPTAATGIITFVATFPCFVFSYGNKLRTLGQYSTAVLRNIGNGVYALSGDLQV